MKKGTSVKMGSHPILEKVICAILIIIPSIPYYIVLPEVINPIIFLILTAVFFLIKNKCFEKIDIFMGILMILSFTSIFEASDKILSLMNSFYFTAPFLIYFIVKNLKAEYGRWCLKYGFYGISISALLGIIRYCTNSDARLDGLLNYANSSALLFAVGIVIYYLCLDEDLLSNFNKVGRYFSRVCLIVCITALYLTQSRGGIIVYFAAIAFGIIFISLHKKSQIIDLCLCNIIGIIYAYTIFSRQYIVLLLISPLLIAASVFEIKEKAASGIKIYLSLAAVIAIGFYAVFRGLSRLGQLGIYNPQLQERFVFYEDALKIIKSNLLGIGAGSYTFKQYFYQSANYAIKYVHNGFLQLTVDFGLIFFVGFVIIIVYLIVKLYKAKKLKSVELLIIVMILVHSMIDFSMSFIYINIILFLCMGILDNYEVNNIEKHEGKKKALQNNRAVTNIFRAILVLIGICIICFLPGQIVYNTAINYANGGNEAAAYKLLSFWKFDAIKTARYYEKLSVYGYDLYSNNKDKTYLNNSLTHINQCLAVNPEDARIYEIKAEICYSSKDYKSTVDNLQLSKKYRKFNPNLYDELSQCYYTMYNTGKLSKAEYEEDLNKIKNERKALKKYINSKAIYMKDQP